MVTPVNISSSQNNVLGRISSWLGRFKAISWIILGISLVGSLIGVLKLSSKINDEEKMHGEVVYSTARVRILESKIRALLGQIELSRRDGKSASELIEDLSKTADRTTLLFETYLSGGKVKAITGRVVYLRAAATPEGISAANELKDVWMPLESEIRAVVSHGATSDAAVSEALQTAQQCSAKFTRLSETLAVEEDKYHETRIDQLTWTRNILGIYLAVVFGLLVPVIILMGQIQKSHAQLSITLASITDGVISIDPQNRIILMNRVAEDLTGWSFDKAKGKLFPSIFRIQSTMTAEAPTMDMPDCRNSFSLHGFTLISHNDERYAIDGNYSPILHEDGRLLGHIAVFRDQSEKQKLQAQMALTSKLQSIGQLAAGVAHEINTPMQFIGDNTGFLRKSFDEIASLLESYQHLEMECGARGHCSEALSKIMKTRQEVNSEYLIKEIPTAIDETLSGIERVTKLVKAMKTFSHPTEGKMQECDLNKSIEATINVCRNEWKYVADLELDLDPDLPLAPCLVDELNQVILNMITNSAHSIQDAIDAGRFQKGTLEIATRKASNEVHIIVRDSGMGMSPEVSKKIFDPFFTTKEPGKGTGQGLAISHDIIVNKHKGRIEVESEIGKGTQFIIVLPLKK